MRSAVGIHDCNSFAGKALENTCLNGSDDGRNRIGVVMGSQTHQDVYFPHIDELAEKIIRQEHLFRQFNLPEKFRSRELVSACPAEVLYFRCQSDPPQPEPVKLVGTHG